jgi:hypothetical protein
LLCKRTSRGSPAVFSIPGHISQAGNPCTGSPFGSKNRNLFTYQASEREPGGWFQVPWSRELQEAQWFLSLDPNSPSGILGLGTLRWGNKPHYPFRTFHRSSLLSHSKGWHSLLERKRSPSHRNSLCVPYASYQTPKRRPSGLRFLPTPRQTA